MIKRTVQGLGILSLAAFFAGGVQAAPLLNEPFDEYANGTTLDSTGNWLYFSPTSAPTLPLTVNNGTVTATNVASGVSGEDDKNTFATAPITTGILYYSALVTTPAGTSVTSTTGDYFLAAYSSTSGYAARVYLAQGSAAGTVAFGLSTATPSGTNVLNKTTDLTLGTEYELVLRYDVAAKTATMGLFAPGTAVTADSQLNIALVARRAQSPVWTVRRFVKAPALLSQMSSTASRSVPPWPTCLESPRGQALTSVLFRSLRRTLRYLLGSVCWALLYVLVARHSSQRSILFNQAASRRVRNAAFLSSALCMVVAACVWSGSRVEGLKCVRVLTTILSAILSESESVGPAEG